MTSLHTTVMPSPRGYVRRSGPIRTASFVGIAGRTRIDAIASRVVRPQSTPHIRHLKPRVRGSR
jgi:hypothetical protein